MNSDNRFILTTRPTDYHIFSGHFQLFKIEDFNKSEVKLFTKNWYSTYNDILRLAIESDPREYKQKHYRLVLNNLIENRIAFQKACEIEPLVELIQNPLLLSLVLLIHSIEKTYSVDNAEGLYEQFVKTLLYRWDDVRNMDFYPTLFGNKHFDRLYEVIRKVAFRFSEKEDTILNVNQIREALLQFIARYGLEPNQVASATDELLKALRDRSGLLTGKTVSDSFDETTFEFQHKTFQDYLTAITLHRDNLLPSGKFSLDDKLGNPFWQKTIEFFVNSGNPDYFFEQYINNIESNTIYINNLDYFIRFYNLARAKDPSLEGKLINKLLAVFFETDLVNEVIYLYRVLHLFKLDINLFVNYFESDVTSEISAYKSAYCALLVNDNHQYKLIRSKFLSKIASLKFKQEFGYNFIEIFLCNYMIIDNEDFTGYKLMFEEYNSNPYMIAIYFDFLFVKEFHRIRTINNRLYFKSAPEVHEEITNILKIKNLLEWKDWPKSNKLDFLIDLYYLDRGFAYPVNVPNSLLYYRLFSTKEKNTPIIDIVSKIEKTNYSIILSGVDKFIEQNRKIFSSLSQKEVEMYFKYY